MQPERPMNDQDALVMAFADAHYGEPRPLADGYAVLALDPEYGGSCPCASFDLDGTKIRLHCWRTCSRCEYVGIHYQGDRAVAERIKPLLDAMDWYGEWPIIEGLH